MIKTNHNNLALDGREKILFVNFMQVILSDCIPIETVIYSPKNQ